MREAKGKFERPDVHYVLVDEAHIRSKVVERWKVAAPHVRFVGFSATPWSQGLAHVYDATLIKGPSVGCMQEKGYLVPIVTFSCGTVDLKGVKTDHTSGDYARADLEKKVMPKINVDVVRNYAEKGDGRPAINCTHGRLLEQQFNLAGIPAAFITGDTEEGDLESPQPGTRQYFFRQMRYGELKVLISVGCVSEGFDLPMVSCVIQARPTKSRMLNMQQIGRGARPSPETGKVDCFVFDHGENYDRLGLITHPDYSSDELDDGEPNSAEAKRKPTRRSPARRGCASTSTPATRAAPSTRRTCASACSAARRVALNAGNLTQWDPPPTIKHVIVFGDSDENFTGQHAAYELGRRLKLRGLHVKVRIPEIIGHDWNDMVDRPREYASA